jgi:NTE family protein
LDASGGESAQKIDLVLEGGGVKGIGLVGALAVLDEHGFSPQNLAGTSAGAITASLLAAGYSPAELHGILAELDFHAFMDTDWRDRIRIRGIPFSLIRELGIYEGEFFLDWIRGLLAEKHVQTFGDLLHPAFADAEPRYRYRLHVIASDITARRLLVLPQDAKDFGVDPDELDVAEAVRMSMSIPIFFEPWRWKPQDDPTKNRLDAAEHLIVDGGVLSNFPVWLFDSEGEPDWPTFGLLLVEPEPRKAVSHRLGGAATAPRPSLVDFGKGLVQTMLEAHDRMYLENASYVRTIQVPTLGVRTTEFDLTRDRANELYEAGRTAAEEFLAHWDFEDYKATFRRGKPPSRRELIELAAKSDPPR